MSMKSIKHKSVWSAGASILALSLLATPAMAQDQESDQDGEDAQVTLNKITITAQKREEGLQDVPISVQALAGEDLKENNIFALDDVAELVPNVTFSSTPGVASIFIRGAGTGSVNDSAEQSVGMFVDGVYASRSNQFNAPFFDLERVEILKGPQGVLQGKNSIAGAVLLTTKRPGDTQEGYVRGSYEVENEGYSIEGGVTLPVSDRWSVRLAGQHNFEGGYIDTLSRTSFDGRSLQGREDQNTYETSVVRLSSTLEATENLDLFAKIEFGSADRTGISFGPSAFQAGAAPIEALFRTLEPNFGLITDGVASSGYFLELDPATNQFVPTQREFYQNVDSRSGLFQFDWDVGDLGTVTGLTGYSEYERQNSNSNTMAPHDGYSSNNLPGTNEEEFDQFTQEIRLVSPQGQTFEYVVGGFYMDRNIVLPPNGTKFNFSNSFLNNVFTIPLTPPGVVPPVFLDNSFLDFRTVSGFTENTESLAAFGQITWNATDDLRFNLGGRYSDETKSVTFDQGGSVFLNPAPFNAIALGIFGIVPFTEADLPASELSESNFDPSISVQYDVTDDLMIYGSWTKATKAGGFNEGANSPAVAIFDEETAKGFEVGLKTAFLNDRGELNLAIFSTEFDDLQVSALDTASAVPTFIFQNAATATSEGFEADVRFAATSELEIGGAIGYLDAAYDDFPGAGCSNGSSQEANCAPVDPTNPQSPISRNAAGDKLRFAPEWTGSVYGEYRKTLSNGFTIGLRGDLKYRDDAFIAATNDPFLLQDAFTKLDLSASLTSPSGRYTASIVGKNVTDETTSSFGGPTPFFSGAYWANVEPPRLVYLNLQANF